MSRVHIRVIDRGPGLAADERDRVFLPFQRSGDTHGPPGIGLGLALSRGLAEAMGGSLEAEDTPGGGLTMDLALTDSSHARACPGASRGGHPVMRVLVVDDEPQILRALRINLNARQFEVITAADGATALDAAKTQRPDLLILDLGLPDTDGVDVIRSLRTWTDVPIIVLSGRAGSSDKIVALNLGADDYVTKPFNIEELLARIKAVSRRLRPETVDDEPVQLGGHTVDLAEKAIRSVDGELVHLTKTEWELLAMLVRNPGKLVSQRQLLQDVWGPTYLNETHYLRQYMAQLRKKLEPDPTRPRHLLTEPGMGYRFMP